MSGPAIPLAYLVFVAGLCGAIWSTLEPGEPIATETLVFGGGGFVLLGLMAATSNDASQRLLGGAWTALHKLGIYVLWIDFIFTYSGTATLAPFQAAMTALFAVAWMTRVVAFWSR
jgi:DMSO/TMAO reductase YedYZ heme-binding membrane subunit